MRLETYRKSSCIQQAGSGRSHSKHISGFREHLHTVLLSGNALVRATSCGSQTKADLCSCDQIRSPLHALFINIRMNDHIHATGLLEKMMQKESSQKML